MSRYQPLRKPRIWRLGNGDLVPIDADENGCQKRNHQIYQTATKLGNLNEYCQIQILRKLTITEQFGAERVCQLWRKLMPRAMEANEAVSFDIDEKLLLNTLYSLEGRVLTEHQMRPALRKLRHITTVKLGHDHSCVASFWFLARCKEQFPKVRSLRFGNRMRWTLLLTVGYPLDVEMKFIDFIEIEGLDSSIMPLSDIDELLNLTPKLKKLSATVEVSQMGNLFRNLSRTVEDFRVRSRTRDGDTLKINFRIEFTNRITQFRRLSCPHWCLLLFIQKMHHSLPKLESLEVTEDEPESAYEQHFVDVISKCHNLRRLSLNEPQLAFLAKLYPITKLQLSRLRFVSIADIDKFADTGENLKSFFELAPNIECLSLRFVSGDCVHREFQSIYTTVCEVCSDAIIDSLLSLNRLSSLELVSAKVSDRSLYRHVFDGSLGLTKLTIGPDSVCSLDDWLVCAQKRPDVRFHIRALAPFIELAKNSNRFIAPNVVRLEAADCTAIIETPFQKLITAADSNNNT